MPQRHGILNMPLAQYSLAWRISSPQVQQTDLIPRGSLTICELPWEGREALLTARDPYQASKNSLTHKRTIKSQAIWPRVFACSQTQIQISERCSSR